MSSRRTEKEAETMAQAAEETTQAEKTETRKPRARGSQVYCGPTVRGVAKQYTVYAGELPEELKLFQLSEQHRRLVVINVQGLRRKGGSLLPEYSEEEFGEATFTFVKYYVQSRHYDELVEENKKLKFELDQEVEWRNRTDN